MLFINLHSCSIGISEIFFFSIAHWYWLLLSHRLVPFFSMDPVYHCLATPLCHRISTGVCLCPCRPGFTRSLDLTCVWRMKVEHLKWDRLEKGGVAWPSWAHVPAILHLCKTLLRPLKRSTSKDHSQGLPAHRWICFTWFRDLCVWNLGCGCIWDVCAFDCEHRVPKFSSPKNKLYLEHFCKECT